MIYRRKFSNVDDYYYPPELLAQAQAIAQNPDDLQKFLIRAIEQEIQRHQITSNSFQGDFCFELGIVLLAFITHELLLSLFRVVQSLTPCPVFGAHLTQLQFNELLQEVG